MRPTVLPRTRGFSTSAHAPAHPLEPMTPVHDGDQAAPGVRMSRSRTSTPARLRPYVVRAFEGDATPHRPSVRGRVARRIAGALAAVAAVLALIPALAGTSLPSLSVSCDPTRVGVETTCRATITQPASTTGTSTDGLQTAKPIASGVFSRDNIPTTASPIHVITKKIHWDTLEPTRDAVTLWPIESVLATAASRGFDGVRLRFSFGVDAPAWAKQIGDGPIDYLETQSNTMTTIPDIWDPAYQAEVQELMAAVAARYDDDPRVLLVFASGAQTYYSEPFIRGISSLQNRKNLLAAGYTKALDLAAQKWQLDIMRIFHRTPIGLAYNPWQYINPDGSAGASIAYMAEVMDYQLSLFGDRTVLQNNSLRSSYISDPPPMYDEFLARLGAPGTTQYQVAGATRIGDADATMKWAINYLKASGVELVNGYQDIYTDAQLVDYDTALKANEPSIPPPTTDTYTASWTTSGNGTFSGRSCAADATGVTTCTVRYLPGSGSAGEHTISAVASGSAISVGPVSTALQVWRRASATTLTCATPIPTGGKSRCTATVSDATGGQASAPGGTVRIDVDGAATGSCTLGAASGSTSACDVDVTAATGTHQVSAAYAGDVDHRTSASEAAPLTVEAPVEEPPVDPPAEEPPPEEPPAPPADTTAPQVEIVSPADGASIVRGTTVPLTATPSDDTGVVRVVFEVNGSTRCTLTQPEWSCAWTAPRGKTGTFTIAVTAFDAVGNSSSDQISVTTVKA